MMKGVFSLILLLSVGSAISVSMTGVFDIAGQIDTAKSIIDLIYDLSTAENLQDALQKFLGQDKVEEKLDQITLKINQLSQKIDNLGSELSMKIDDVAISIITRLKTNNRLAISEFKIVEWMLDVKNWYNQYREYRNLTFGYPSMSIEQFAIDVTNVHAKSFIEKLYQFTIPGGTGISNFKGIIELILTEAQEEARENCGHGLSKHQELYNLYVSTMMTESKYFIISSYAYKQLAKRHPNENYFNEFQRLLNDFDRRARGYLASFRAGMRISSKSIRACDPAIHVKGVTYLELERLFGPYVINEYDMNVIRKTPEPDSYYPYSFDKCASTCDDPEGYRHVDKCQSGFCHDHQHFCRGKLQNCQTAKNLEFCMREDFKRYEAMKFNDHLYGGELTCPNSRKSTAGSWIRMGGSWATQAGGPWSCDTCVCTCAYDKLDTGYSFMRIHKEMMNADIDKNNVITGVKFEVIECTDWNDVKYQLLHLKIRQGKLSKWGRIVGESWKSPPTENTGFFFRINDGDDQDTVQAAMLHNVNAPDGYVVIGVALETSPDSRMFGIRIKAAKVNFETGELDASQIYDSGKPSIPHLTELNLRRPDSPLKPARNLLDSNGKEIVKFQMSDLEKDAGASTVPFFDLQSVLTLPAFPLTGVGLIHRGREGFGGFIAPTVDTYEFSNDIKLPSPPRTYVV